VSTGGSNSLQAFDGDTGATVFGGGGPASEMGTIQHWTSPIVAKGRFYVAGSDSVYAFTSP